MLLNIIYIYYRVCSTVLFEAYETNYEFCAENHFLWLFFSLPASLIFETFQDVARPTQTKLTKII